MKRIDELVTAFHEVFVDAARHAVTIPGKPIPASRPRVSRWGTYYGKTYDNWRKLAASVIESRFEPATGPLAVLTIVVLPKAKSSKLDYPRGDIDNYEKAVWDSVTNNRAVWQDDNQIVCSTTLKAFESGDYPEAGVYLTIYELEIQECVNWSARDA